MFILKNLLNTCNTTDVFGSWNIPVKPEVTMWQICSKLIQWATSRNKVAQKTITEPRFKSGLTETVKNPSKSPKLYLELEICLYFFFWLFQVLVDFFLPSNYCCLLEECSQARSIS